MGQLSSSSLAGPLSRPYIDVFSSLLTLLWKKEVEAIYYNASHMTRAGCFLCPTINTFPDAR